VTCRIDRQAIGDARVLVRVSGWITGDNVSTLRTLLGEEKSSALILDLKDVRSVDSEAVKLLAIHESKGARIDNCPLYIRERIRRERDAT
jgi:anti-anti-sigma regulatory factor